MKLSKGYWVMPVMALFLIAGMGCRSSVSPAVVHRTPIPPIVGKWRGTVWTPGNGPVETIFDFQSDNEARMTMTFPTENLDSGKEVPGQMIVLSGTYQVVAGQDLNCDFQSATDGKKTRALPEEFNSFHGPFKITGQELRWKGNSDISQVVFTRER